MAAAAVSIGRSNLRDQETPRIWSHDEAASDDRVVDAVVVVIDLDDRVLLIGLDQNVDLYRHALEGRHRPDADYGPLSCRGLLSEERLMEAELSVPPIVVRRGPDGLVHESRSFEEGSDREAIALRLGLEGQRRRGGHVRARAARPAERRQGAERIGSLRGGDGIFGGAQAQERGAVDAAAASRIRGELERLAAVVAMKGVGGDHGRPGGGAGKPHEVLLAHVTCEVNAPAPARGPILHVGDEREIAGPLVVHRQRPRSARDG